MVEKDRHNYRSIINRKVAILACFFGLLEVLAGVFIIICAFIMLGGFCENLDCPGFSKGIGFWIGFPLLIPGILGLVVLGTRHIQATHIFMITNACVLILSIVHTILVYQDYDDFWNGLNKQNNAGSCSVLGANNCECVQAGAATVIKYPFQCDLIEFGYELNWILFGASIASIVLTACSIVTGIVGRAMASVLPRHDR